MPNTERRPPLHAALAAIATAIAVVVLAACATTQTNVRLRMADATTLALVLRERDLGMTTMKTAAVMEYTGGGQHFKARENIVVRRPASIRVEAMSALGVAMVVAADQGQIAVFDTAKNTFVHGPASAAVFQRYTRIPMTPEAAVRLLLALPPDSSMLAAPPASLTEPGPPDNLTLLTYPQPGNLRDHLGFSDDMQLAMVRETLANGRISYEVHYSDYQTVGGGIRFPHQVDARFPMTGASVKFVYDNISFDSDIPDSTFVLSPGPGTRMFNLSRGSPLTAMPRG